MSSSHSRNDRAGRSLSPEFVLLGCLAVQPAHGYELHQRLTADLGRLWRLSQSQVYTILHRLEQQGLLTGAREPQDKSPDRRVFQLTPAGRQRFDAWLHAPTRGGVQAIRLHFISRLYFAHLLTPAAVPDLVQAQMTETARSLARLREELAALPCEQTFNRMGLDLRIRQITVALAWLAQCMMTPPASEPDPRRPSTPTK